MIRTLSRTALVRRGMMALLSAFLTLLANCPAVGAETNVVLGRAAPFAVLAGSSINATGDVVVVGTIGVAPGTSVVGIPRTSVRINTRSATNAQFDLAAAYNNAAGRTNPAPLPGELGGLTLTPGLYNAAGSVQVSSGDLTLDAQGNPAAVFIFQVGSNLTVAPTRDVILAGAARAANIFWQVGGSAALGANSATKGTIMANDSITMESRATLDGRALARSGDVVLAFNVITVPTGGTTNDPPLDVFVLDSVRLNPQTGLFEQPIRIRNVSTNEFEGVAALIRGLPADVRAYNGNSSAVGGGVVTHDFPLAPGETVDLMVEYYRASRQIFTQPTYFPTIVIPPDRNPQGRLLSVDRAIVLQSGRVLIEFEADIGKRYAIQYNTNGVDGAWLTADPTITAAANRVQWLDDGPPKTVSPPGGVGTRLYRVVELP
jgi:hypothetical protein